jgi:hypothetical protein
MDGHVAIKLAGTPSVGTHTMLSTWLDERIEGPGSLTMDHTFEGVRKKVTYMVVDCSGSAARVKNYLKKESDKTTKYVFLCNMESAESPTQLAQLAAAVESHAHPHDVVVVGTNPTGGVEHATCFDTLHSKLLKRTKWRFVRANTTRKHELEEVFLSLLGAVREAKKPNTEPVEAPVVVQPAATTVTMTTASTATTTVTTSVVLPVSVTAALEKQVQEQSLEISRLRQQVVSLDTLLQQSRVATESAVQQLKHSNEANASAMAAMQAELRALAVAFSRMAGPTTKAD